MKPLNTEMLQFVRRALGVRKSAVISITPLTKRGSNRSFHRITYGDRDSVIFMVYDPIRKENGYYAAVADFLLTIHVPAPRIIAHDPLRCFILMEDLGERDLWSCRNDPWARRRTYYCASLLMIHRLHAFPIEDFPLHRVPLMEGFSTDLYKWERDYFFENFVHAVCGLKLNRADQKALETEFEGLTGRLLEPWPSLVHRDLQSQNVMIYGEQPTFVDFQGMRFGNFFYDLGSLLYDPYVSLTEDERMDLLHHYYKLTDPDGTGALRDHRSRVAQNMNFSPRADWTLFQDRFRDASAQRLMQALGAYGFLGLKSDLPEFLTHIPAGIANLIDSTARARYLPLLKDLAVKCKHSLTGRLS